MSKRPRIKTLSAALAVALGLASVSGHAQSAKETELEARIAELEATVKRLANALEIQQVEVKRVAEAAPPAPPPNAAQDTTITPGSGSGTRFSFGGFIKANATYSDFSDGNPAAGSAARDFHIPGAIPVGGQGEDAVFDAHAKYSRIQFGTDTPMENGQTLSSRIEFDFGVLNGGDERATNRYVPSLRRAFVSYGNWLGGQEWSNFMELGMLPESTDFVGPTEGLVFVRQPQVRYTSGPWSVALENPETTLTPFGGGARIINDDNNLPDLTLRYKHSADWGFISASGVVRQLKYQIGGASDSTGGYGLSVAGKLLFGEDDLRFMATVGSGIGRYVGINYFNDAVLDANGDLEPIDLFAATLGYRHVWSKGVRSNFIVGYTEADNDRNLTGGGANASAYSLRANLFWDPLPKVTLGVEISTATRELEDHTSGAANRIDFMAKHSF